MNSLDLLLAVPLLWGAYKGFQKGLVHEVTTFVALFAGIYGALHYSGIAEPYLKEALDTDPDYLPLIAFGVTFLAILIAVHFIGRILDRLVKWVALGLINRILGSLFGLLKIALFLIGILILIRSYTPGEGSILPEKGQEESVLLSWMDRATEEVMRYDLGSEWSSDRGAKEN